MSRTREHSLPTRQLYASIREDIYLAAKSRAAELRLPMRRFIEDALVDAISLDEDGVSKYDESLLKTTPRLPSVWDDQYLQAQARQPLGAPLNLSEDEARRVALGAFHAASEPSEPAATALPQRLEGQARGRVGDPVELSDEDAEQIAREALTFSISGISEASDG